LTCRSPTRLFRVVERRTTLPSTQQAYAELGATPWPASSAEISKFRDDEEKRLLPIMQAAGIKPT
jgi:hypothetical protein